MRYLREAADQQKSTAGAPAGARKQTDERYGAHVPEEVVQASEEGLVSPMTIRREWVLEADKLAMLVLQVMCFGVVWCRAGLYRDSARVDTHGGERRRPGSQRGNVSRLLGEQSYERAVES